MPVYRRLFPFRRRNSYLYLLAGISITILYYSWGSERTEREVVDYSHDVKAQQTEAEEAHLVVSRNGIIKDRSEFREGNLIIVEPRPEEKDLLEHPQVFWDSETEDTLNKKQSSLQNRCADFQRKLQQYKIADLHASTWNECGREGNAFGKFTNGAGNFCIRYRHPHDYFVAGEVLSFHLAGLLGIATVPCVQMGTTNGSTIGGGAVQWPVDVSGELQWETGRPIAFIEWVPRLRGGLQIPNALLQALNSHQPIRSGTVRNMSLSDRSILAQWTDLIVFDYLNGHHDRFARLQDDSEKEGRQDILQSSVPNMGMDPDGLLWFFDNEPGLLDAYSLMYSQDTSVGIGVGDPESVRFRRFHDQMLNTTCVFRKRTIAGVLKLIEMTAEDSLAPFRTVAEAGKRLLADEDGRGWLEEDEKWSRYLKENFRQRLISVVRHVQWCIDVFRER